MATKRKYPETKTGNTALLAKLVGEGMEKLGAVKLAAHKMYQYAIWTRAGILEITPRSGWIACEFRDVEQAKRTEVIFSPSGKWNFHYDKSMTPEAMANDFFAVLETLTTPHTVFRDAKIALIAGETLKIDLKEQGGDRLDFHDLHVASISAALAKAYNAGFEAAKCASKPSAD